ncbi:MAG: hypothetical protein Ct9H300mP5_4920 [Candidatus Pelagibacterales bacterium]|nr:MAG: hypothetical protein Ct9H300mP5_4920 [Pelagibacterales bacterium]
MSPRGIREMLELNKNPYMNVPQHMVILGENQGQMVLFFGKKQIKLEFLKSRT